MVYFNEIDPFCAQWCRNAFQGDVDERDIRHIERPVVAVRQHYFAGIGGWEYALQLAGWPDDREVWTGSCPCQPFSVAGNRQAHTDERDLWPAFFRLIALARPAVILGEQVNGAIAFGWLDRVCDDLEGIGYAVGAAVLPACGVGAPHIRQRLYWVAHSSPGGAPQHAGAFQPQRGEPRPRSEDGGLAVSNDQGQSELRFRSATNGDASSRHNPDGGLQDGGMAQSESPDRWRGESSVSSAAGIVRRGLGRNGKAGGVADPPQRGQRIHGRPPRSTGHPELGIEAGSGLGNSDESGCETLEPLTVGDESRPQRAAQPGSSGGLGDPVGSRLETLRRNDRPAQGHPERTGQWDASQSIRCADGRWRRIPLESGFQPLANSGRFGNPRINPDLSSRIGALQGAGNAIVIPLAAEFIRAVMELQLR